MMPPDRQFLQRLESPPPTSAPVSFKYFLADRSDPVTEDGDLWNASIPLSRNPQADDFANPAGPTYGDYFTAVRHFLEDRQCQVLTAAIRAAGSRPCLVEDIEGIDIFLVKHGQFYHPCRVDVLVKNHSCAFVVNVAVSTFGKYAIEREFNLLNHLASIHSSHYVPVVYAYGAITMPSGFEVKMFLAEWFDDFHEFHLSRHPISDQVRIRVWHADHPPRYLTDAETEFLYQEIAKIITCCYNPETFEQIHPWHHAAGDFVVCYSGDPLQVRLITVRNYGALLENANCDETTLLEAMLFFLTNLSIRTRLDRLDGVGDIVWADTLAVNGTVQGFMDGLKSKIPRWDHRFRQFLKSFSVLDFIEICEATADSYHPLAPEIPVIRRHLQQHATEVYESMTAFLK